MQPNGDNLPLLRDIHLPADIRAFPLGYSWVVIVAGIVLLVVLYQVLKYLKTKSKKYYALKLLREASADTRSDVCRISAVLRRICLYKYKEAASLFGKPWVDFLNRHSRTKINGAAAELLVYAPYLPSNGTYSAEDYRRLRHFAKEWIGENL